MSDIINIKNSIEQNKMLIAYQPIISSKTKKVCSVESLLRFENSDYNSRIKEIIHIAEDLSLIDNITYFMFDNIIQDYADWFKQGSIDNDFKISINISQFMLKEDFLIKLKQKLNNQIIKNQNIIFEISGTNNLKDEKQEIIQKLSSQKFNIALDDFGIGESLLSNLVKIPYQILKIDKSFMQSIESNNLNSDIMQLIMSLSNKQNFKVICEGIETDKQAKLLEKMNCEYQQGFLYSKPVFKKDLLSTIKDLENKKSH